MEILVLNYEYPPLGAGAAPVCRDLAAEMAKQGHRVTVVTMSFRGLPGREEKDGVKIIRLKCLRKHEHSCSPHEQLSYIHHAKCFLKKHLKTHQYDVCHTHFIFPTGPVSLWLKKRYGIPYVLTAHGSDVEGHNSKLSMRIMHRFLRPSWKTIVREAYVTAAPSEHLLRLMNHVYHSRRYVWISNGLDIGKYHQAGITKEKRVLVMGRMQRFKNVQTLLRAFAKIPVDRWDGWQVDILGDGPYRRKLEELASELHITDRITFCGWLVNGSEEQINFLRKASVYVSASHFENCPMSVLEALASGCYPLLSDIEGHRQFFRGEADCFFFKPDDPEELAGKLEILLSAEPKGFPADKVNISAYDNAIIAAKYLRLLERAVKKKEA